MKKIIILSSIPIGVASVTTAIVVPVVLNMVSNSTQAINANNKERFEAFQKDSKASFVDYKLDKSLNIIDSLNKADINLFYNGAGAITTVYMQQLSMLAAAGDSKINTSKEVHFAMAPDAWEPQAKVNKDELTRLLKLGNPNSSIINVHNDSHGRIVDQWLEIIKSNPDKKINVWWNSDHLQHENGSYSTSVLDLAYFKNVNIQLLEDGASIGLTMKDTMTADNLKLMQNQNLQIDNKTQYLLPALFENVRSWFTAPAVINMNSIFNYIGGFAAKDLPEALFNTRITDNGVATRLFTYWTKISGNDWHDALAIMQKASQEFPGKKNMLILGSYGAPREEEYIKYLYDKYAANYNIFYKGRPGHMEHTDFVNNELVKNQDLKGLYTFEPSIASEELTRDHFNDGIKFDKVAVVGATSALFGFPDYDMNQLFTDAYAQGTSKEFVANTDNEWASEVGQWLIH